MLAAVVFDFDGIIVDTEPLHYRAFQAVQEPLGLGYSWEEYLERYIGFDDRDAFRELFRSAGRELDDTRLAELIAAKAAAFQEIIRTPVPPYPGVVELIAALAGEVPLAICSGALRSDILPILDQLGVGDAFDVLVTADDVAVSKPDPASYCLAVQRLAVRFPTLGVTPTACVAIEDTPAGITSARGAGLRVLAVSNSYPAERLTAADGVVPSLAGVSLSTLSTLGV